MKVIEQPFGSRTDVVAGPGVHPDVLVCLAQHGDVLAQARKERRPTGSRSAGSVRLAKTAAMLRETLLTENLGAYRRLQRTPSAVQNVTDCRRRFGQQLHQSGGLHAGPLQTESVQVLEPMAANVEQYGDQPQRGHEMRAHQTAQRAEHRLQRQQTAMFLLAALQVQRQRGKFHG